MNHRIIQASDFALHILKNKRNGEIHSVYRKTINIRMDGVLLALQACQSPVSPISLITELTEDSMKDLHLQEGTAVTVTDSSVNLGSHAFSFHDSEIIQTELKETLSFSCIQLLKEHLKTVILSSHTGGFDTIFHLSQRKDSPLPSLILEGSRSYLSQAYYSILDKDYTSSSSSLRRLIGLGTGLTPSGDDFLCGLLAGLILIGKEASPFALLLKEEIRTHLSNTNDISQAFLCCALDGRFSLPVLRLTDIPEAMSIHALFQQIGHSSGIDTLCGILFALGMNDNIF